MITRTLLAGFSLLGFDVFLLDTILTMKTYAQEPLLDESVWYDKLMSAEAVVGNFFRTIRAATDSDIKKDKGASFFFIGGIVVILVLTFQTVFVAVVSATSIPGCIQNLKWSCSHWILAVHETSEEWPAGAMYPLRCIQGRVAGRREIHETSNVQRVLVFCESSSNAVCTYTIRAVALPRLRLFPYRKSSPIPKGAQHLCGRE